VPDTLHGYPLRAFVICLIAYTTAQMDLALFGYAVPAIRAEFGLALSEVMAIVSMAFLLGGVLLVFLGWLADRVGRLPLFQFSLLGSSALVASDQCRTWCHDSHRIAGSEHRCRGAELPDYRSHHYRGDAGKIARLVHGSAADWVSAWVGAGFTVVHVDTHRIRLAAAVLGGSGQPPYGLGGAALFTRASSIRSPRDQSKLHRPSLICLRRASASAH
jgi:MFS family permease